MQIFCLKKYLFFLFLPLMPWYSLCNKSIAVVIFIVWVVDFIIHVAFGLDSLAFCAPAQGCLLFSLLINIPIFYLFFLASSLPARSVKFPIHTRYIPDTYPTHMNTPWISHEYPMNIPLKSLLWRKGINVYFFRQNILLVLFARKRLRRKKCTFLQHSLARVKKK